MAKEKNKARGVGRPYKIQAEQLRKLEDGFKIGFNNEEACAYADVGTTAFYEFLKRNPEYTDKIKQWKNNPKLKAKHTIFKNLDDVRNAQWYLEHKCDEFSNKQKIDLNSTGINIVVQDTKHQQMLEDL